MLHESIMVPSFSAISDNAIAIYLDTTALYSYLGQHLKGCYPIAS